MVGVARNSLRRTLATNSGVRECVDLLSYLAIVNYLQLLPKLKIYRSDTLVASVLLKVSLVHCKMSAKLI